MKHHDSHRAIWLVLVLSAAALAVSHPSSMAASPADGDSAMGPSTHSHEAMHQMPRLQPKRVLTVTGNEDWGSLRGFGKDSAMAEMMTLMMVGGSGMEHMKMAPMKRGGKERGDMDMAAMAAGATDTADQKNGLNLSATVSPNPPIVGDNTLDIAVTDASGKPVTGLKLTTSVAMTSMDMGTERPKVVEGQEGHYTTAVNFSMKGPWRVTLTASAPGNQNAGLVRAALDFHVGSKEKWGPPAGPKVVLNTPAGALKVGKNVLSFTLLNGAGRPITGAKVTTAVGMTSMDMGTAHPKAQAGKDGRYTTEVEFSMAGPWRVTLTIAAPNQKPFTRAFDFNVKA
jgi:hypothetical protein